MNTFVLTNARGRLLNILVPVLLALALSAHGEESPQTNEKVETAGAKFISPDGKYGLLLADEDRVELIEVASKHPLVLLSDPESPEIPSKARLDWSKDSKKVAAYTATRVDGFTRFFIREGDGFVEVKLPDLPDLPNPEEPSAEFRKKHKFEFLKWIDAGTLKFVRWLDSGDLQVQSYNEVATVGGKVFRAEINATIAIDSKGHATLKKVARKESLE
jgi:hypothetical protein